MPATPEYITAYRRKRRFEAIATLGGKCADCGSTDSLEFDHIDPATKVASIASMLTASKVKLAAEVAKCQLLCTPCHVARTRSQPSRPPWNKGLVTARHGTASRYRAGCRCEPCRDAKRATRSREGERRSR